MRFLAYPLYKLGTAAFAGYVRLMGKDGEAATLIACLAWLRGYAEDHALDFRAAVVSSGRRGTDDWPQR